MTERPGNRLACPDCLSPDYLGENVLGWRGVRHVSMVEGKVAVVLVGREINDAERVSFFCSNRGCNVDKEIPERRLVQIDDAGRPITEQPDEQGRLV